MEQDRYLAPDIAHATALVKSGALAKILRTLSALPELWINRNPDS
jgi:histidine ammonia-lyase